MSIPLVGWVRTAVVPRHGRFRHHEPHTLAAPLVRHLLAQAGLPARAVDALILGNALGAGGNPARLTALAAELPERCMALTVDTQCCAGLDAITLGATQILAGQADIVIAGGSEAWSRAPIRQHRPLHPDGTPVSYERPAFTPWPDRDPDLLQAAADHAARHGWTRAQQDAWAQRSHRQALRHAHDISLPDLPDRSAASLLVLEGARHDPGPRLLTPRHLGRMPVLREPAPHAIPHHPPGMTAAGHATRMAETGQSHHATLTAEAGKPQHATPTAETGQPQHATLSPETEQALHATPGNAAKDRHALSMVAVSPQADGAALLLLASERACRHHGLSPRAHWMASQSLGTHPTDPLTGALAATLALLARQNVLPRQLHALELHDAFAVQGLAFARAMQARGVAASRINAWGGGLARGHPIGASGAVALVQLLARLAAFQASPASPASSTSPVSRVSPHPPQSATHLTPPASPEPPTSSRLGLACIAGAGGLGSAVLVSHEAVRP